MYISNIYIRGYKSVKEDSFNLHPGTNVFIGRNNVGKSNLFSVLDILLGDRWPTYQKFERSDFYTTQEESVDHFAIAVELSFSDNEDISHIEKELSKAYFKSDIWTGDISTFLSKKYNFYKKNASFTDESVRRSLLGNSTVTLTKDTKLTITLMIHQDCFGDAEDDQTRYFTLLLSNPSTKRIHEIAINKKIRSALVTSAIIPAFRQPDGILRNYSYLWYGKMIRHFFNKGLPPVLKKVEGLMDDLSLVSDSIFADLNRSVSEYLDSVLKGHKVNFSVSAPPKELYKNLQIGVRDTGGGEEMALEKAGSGLQSNTIAALMIFYAKTFHTGNTILVFEEPELFLHPAGRRRVARMLRKFSEEENAQIILTTHSHEFVKHSKLANIFKVVQLSNQGTTVQKLNVSSGAGKALLTEKMAELFFADKAILVEGKNDRDLLELCMQDRKTDGLLDIHETVIIDCGGKDGFSKYRRLAEKIRVKTLVIADLDFVYKERGRIDTMINSKEGKALIESLATKVGIFLTKQGTAIKLPPSKTKNDIVKAMDWVIKEIYSGTILVKDLSNHWDKIKISLGFISPIKKMAEDDPEIREIVDKIIIEAEKDNVIVLKLGEIEDYTLDEAGGTSTVNCVKAEVLSGKKELKSVLHGDYIDEVIKPVEEFILQDLRPALLARFVTVVNRRPY